MSSRESLHRYHDTKYAADAVAPLDRVVEYKSSPSNRFEACLKYFPTRFRGGDILELGAGSGLVARSLIANGLKFNTYTLSEFSQSRLKGLSQSFADPRIRVVKLDAESIPDDELNRYDAIIMMALIAQLVDPLGAMQQNPAACKTWWLCLYRDAKRSKVHPQSKINARTRSRHRLSTRRIKHI